jgi:hypothetical protein
VAAIVKSEILAQGRPPRIGRGYARWNDRECRIEGIQISDFYLTSVF